MIQDAAHNLHLREQTKRLLLFYADQTNGFRPALKLIEQKTGIAGNKVAEIRRRLVDRGLIAYEPEDYVAVDWRRIKTFAALEKPLRLPSSGNYFFAPARPCRREKTIGQICMEKGWWIKNPRPLTATEKTFYDAAESMTESGFMELMALLDSNNGGT